MKRAMVIAAAAAMAFGCDKADPKPDSTAVETSGTAVDQSGGTVDGAEPAADEEESTEDGAAEIEISPLQHGSFYLTSGDLVVAFDPTTSALEAAAGEEPKADIIFVTHIHGDHLDPEAIATLRKDGAPVVTPNSVADKAGDALPEPTIMAARSSTVASGTPDRRAGWPWYRFAPSPSP